MSFYQETMRKLRGLNSRVKESEEEFKLSCQNEEPEIVELSVHQAPLKTISVTEPKGLGELMSPMKGTSNQNQISEQQLARELLFAFQGISGNLIYKTDSDQNCHVYNLTCRVTDESMRQKVLHLATLGTLYQKLREFIEQNSVDGVSLYLSAFASNLDQKLCGYTYLLSQIESQLAAREVTLIQLRLETYLTKKNLEWLVMAVEACRHRFGANVLSTLHHLMLNGNPQVFRNLSSIFLKVSEVFYTMLEDWFSGSKLVDPHDEFFIVANPEMEAEAFYFNDYYSISDMMSPQFLTQAQISRVLSIGKNYSLLMQILGRKNPLPDLYKRLRQEIKTVTTDPKLGVNAWGPGGRMHLFMLEMENCISKALVQALLIQGKLNTHLNVLTGFLLLRQSGFAAQIITRMFDLLTVSAHIVPQSLLKLNLQLAVSNVMTSDQEEISVDKIINLQFNPQPEHDVGWDCFGVVYNIAKNDPIKLIITDQVMEKYYAFFKEILQLRRMEWMLCDVLKSIKTTYRKLHQLTGQHRIVLNQMHLVAKEMHVLIQQVLNNILQVRLEANWHQFTEQIQGAASLRAVEQMHEKYLTSIKLYLFPSQMHELLQQTIELNDLYQSFMLAFKLPMYEVREGDNLSCSENETSTPCKTVFCPSSVPHRLENLRRDFYELVIDFLRVIKVRPEEDMQHLYELINLNDFFEAS